MEAKTFSLSILSAITAIEIVPEAGVSKLAVRKRVQSGMLLLLDWLDAFTHNRTELGVTATSTVVVNGN